MRRLLIVLTLALMAAACGGGRTAPPRPAASAPSLPQRASTAPEQFGALLSGSRLLREIQEPAFGGYAADGSLYLADTVPAAEHTAEIYELTRLDPTTGRVVARRRLSNVLDGTLLARGSLWVTTSAGSLTSLWRLNPRSLAVRSETGVPSSRFTEGITGSLAAAGGQLWVGAGKLDRVSLATGRVDRVVTPPFRGPVQLAADRSGAVLLGSFGYVHPTYIVRLDPRTGAALSHLIVPRSVSQPSFGGIIDGGAWIENVVGARTTAWRLDVSTLRATKTSPWPATSNRIQVRVIDGVLWVTEPLGRDNLNYCADPVTGQPRARLPLLRGDSVFLTADAADIYYTDVPVNAHSVKLERAPLGRACVS